MMEILLDINRINANIFHFLQLVNRLPEDTCWIIEVLFDGDNIDGAGMWDTTIDIRESGLSKKLVLVGGLGASDGFNRMYFNTDTNRHKLEYYRTDHSSVMQADRIREHLPKDYSLSLKTLRIDCITQEECNLLDKMFRAYICNTTPKHSAFYSVTWMGDGSWSRILANKKSSGFRGNIEIRITDLMTGPVVAHISFNIDDQEYKRIMRSVGTDQNSAAIAVGELLSRASETSLTKYNMFNYNRSLLIPSVDAYLNDSVPPIKHLVLWSNLENGTKLRLLQDLFVVNDMDKLQDLQYQNFTNAQLAECMSTNQHKDEIFVWNSETSEVIGSDGEMGQDTNGLVDEELWEILNED